MTLDEEAQRYLAVVDVFRAEGYEPTWRPESAPAPIKRPADARDVCSSKPKQRRKTC
jgi:hypothetical protein